MGAERRINCEQMQAQSSLDVETAFDVAKPSVVSQILTLTGGHVVAALGVGFRLLRAM